jgi:hypothetical protein
MLRKAMDGFDHILIRLGLRRKAPNPMSFVGDPGGARTHDPLIKSQRLEIESTAYSGIECTQAPSRAPSEASFDQRFDQVHVLLCRGCRIRFAELDSTGSANSICQMCWEAETAMAWWGAVAGDANGSGA